MPEDKVIIDDVDFDFDKANTAGAKPNSDNEKESAPDEDEMSLEDQFNNLSVDHEILKEKVAEQGKVIPKIIAEARELAGSKKGLDIDTFFTKHKLVGVDIEQLLNAPLKKDGTYA